MDERVLRSCAAVSFTSWPLLLATNQPAPNVRKTPNLGQGDKSSTIGPRGGYPHAPAASVQRRVQGAGSVGSPQRAETRRRGAPRVSAQGRVAQSLESRLCEPGVQRVCGRRTNPASRTARRGGGTARGALDAGGGDRKKAALLSTGSNGSR